MTGKIVAYEALLLCLCVLWPATALTRAVENYSWIEARSENFVIRSALSERQTVKTLRHLEMLRNSMAPGLLFHNKSRPVPEVIYLLKGTRPMRQLGFSGDGFNYIDVDDGKFLLAGSAYYAWRAILPAYARFVIAEEAADDCALWYEEGLVDYFGSSRLRKGDFRYGEYSGRTVVRGRVNVDRVGEIFTLTSHDGLTRDRHADIHFYYWLLVRYLTESDSDWVAFGDRLHRYVKMTGRGEDPAESFEAAFGIDVEELGRELYSFNIQACCGVYVVPLEEVIPAFEPEVSELSREEAALGLAEIAAHFGATERALSLYDVAMMNERTRDAAMEGTEKLQRAGGAED